MKDGNLQNTFIYARRLLFLLIGLICFTQTFASTVEDTVYINRGTILTVDSTYLPYFAFNSSNVFNKENKRLILNIGDTMLLTIINTDSISHGFDIKSLTNINQIIPAFEASVISYSFQTEGVHIYFDHTQQGAMRYMGLGAMIVVENPNSSASRFYWNMKEHQKSFNETIDIGELVDWTAYYPDYFTINGNSNPHINQDENARVTGSIGDTIHIYMVNTGQSIHSIHFHGYHSEILYSSKFSTHVGRSKDTFGVYSMESVIVELIPHQNGEFPVHDHNLVAVSGGNFYPNGMFLTILIE